MELDVEYMDILCLRIIANRLKSIKTLTLQVKGVVTVNNSTLVLQEKDVETIIENFRTYCQGIEGAVNVKFRCKGRQEMVEISYNN